MNTPSIQHIVYIHSIAWIDETQADLMEHTLWMSWLQPDTS